VPDLQDFPVMASGGIRVESATVNTLVPEHARERLDEPEPACSDPAHERLNLVTAVLATHAPLAEMLAVVREHVIALFTESRTGTTHYFRTILHSRLAGPNPDFPSVREPTQRYLLDTTSA
jgi:hypothetical protein